MKARLCLLLLPGLVAASTIKPDESVVFFPSLGSRTEDGRAWELEVHGWIFEAERRSLTLPLLRKVLGIGEDLSSEEKAVFAARARSFLVDNERGKRLSVRLGEKQVRLEPSGDDGHIRTRLLLTAEQVDRWRSKEGRDSPLRFHAVTAKNDSRAIAGEVYCLDATGLSVISDIDDTIKISEVTDKKALLRMTFLKAFEPVPGMAEVYRSWVSSVGAQFHYVSASPWQLYRPLADFIRDNGFPEGSFHLKPFRVKDETFFDLFRSPEGYKLGVLEPLLNRFPDRQFILVGDSGERDPEIYGTLARKYPDQVRRVFIRELTDADRSAERYREAFSEIPAGKWDLFRDPAEIRSGL
jgi:hypothetical protein